MSCHRQPEQTKRRLASITTEQLEAASENILWGEQTNKYSGLTGANSGSASERVFRTGDLGVITSHGLEIRGRLDLQSKVGGRRPRLFPCISVSRPPIGETGPNIIYHLL